MLLVDTERVLDQQRQRAFKAAEAEGCQEKREDDRTKAGIAEDGAPSGDVNQSPRSGGRRGKCARFRQHDDRQHQGEQRQAGGDVTGEARR